MEKSKNVSFERRKKMEIVLAEACRHADFVPTYDAGSTEEQYRISGEIGNIKFLGIWFRERNGETFINEEAQISFEHLNERGKRTPLGMIATEKGFVERKFNKIKIANATDLLVVSPKWREAKMIVSDTQFGLNANKQPVGRVRVFCSANEKADDVVNRIYSAVAKNKIQVTDKEKLSKVNLAKQQTKTNGREM